MTDVTPYDEDDDEPADDREPQWWSVSSLLSPEASAVTALTFAVLSVLGGSAPGYLTQALLGFSLDNASNARWHLVLPSVVSLLFALAGLLLGAGVVRQGWDEPPSWSGQLARAAVVVGAVGAVLAAVTVVAGLAQSVPTNALMAG